MKRLLPIVCGLFLFRASLFAQSPAPQPGSHNKPRTASSSQTVPDNPSSFPTEAEDRAAEAKIRVDKEDVEGTEALFKSAQEVEDAYRSGDKQKVLAIMTETAQQTIGAEIDKIPAESLKAFADDFRTRILIAKSPNYAEFAFRGKDGIRFTSAFARTGLKSWAQMR